MRFFVGRTRRLTGIAGPTHGLNQLGTEPNEVAGRKLESVIIITPAPRSLNASASGKDAPANWSGTAGEPRLRFGRGFLQPHFVTAWLQRGDTCPRGKSPSHLRRPAGEGLTRAQPMHSRSRLAPANPPQLRWRVRTSAKYFASRLSSIVLVSCATSFASIVHALRTR